MKIHKEGFTTVPTTVLIMAVVLGPICMWLGPFSVYSIILGSLAIVFLGLVISFFRVPKRSVVIGNDHIVAPADGKVVVIEKVVEEEYFKDERLQISIFMSPLNVHVNWDPIEGKVVYTKYHKGKYLVAWHPKSSTMNERSTVVIDHATHGKILIRQIAGAVARRIRTYNEEGDEVQQGSELGFIKFGSRVDIFLPINAQVNVNAEDKVVGLETVIATFAKAQE